MRDQRRSIVKICGLSTAAHAHATIVHGADLLGFVFAPSRRQVRPATVRAIRDELAGPNDALPPFVGVFVNPSVREIAETVELAGLDLVQLSGDEDSALAGEFDLPYIRAIRIGAATDPDDALHAAERWMSLSHRPEFLLVDTAIPGSYGGSGHRANWDVAQMLAERYPTLLAGGLNHENVAEGLAATGAWGVDVSSGVEADGAKSVDLIARFIAAAHSATQPR